VRASPTEARELPALLLLELQRMKLTDVLCFSHLRWNFVFQRPNHLMTRCARERRVFFIEEPVPGEADELEVRQVAENLLRVVPHLASTAPDARCESLVRLLETLCSPEPAAWPIHWLYTPMMLPISERLPSSLTVYDCMDELSNFLHAPPELRELEKRLLSTAAVVFTGGNALYRAKHAQHPNVHLVPSSVDARFFGQARKPLPEPEDQAAIAHPRIGYCGVIDERIDLALLDFIAEREPTWQLIMLGPVVKVDPAQLPRRANIHYLGLKAYDQLPRYLASWDAAMLPFARNDATRFISPTKTPEYLAAGRQVVSTAIDDVVEPYERLGLVRIGRDHAQFAHELAAVLRGERRASDADRDAFLATSSWDTSWERMRGAIEAAQRIQRIDTGLGSEADATEGKNTNV
jgi:glycosyltransferase involved in cell wall biosynthesis